MFTMFYATYWSWNTAAGKVGELVSPLGSLTTLLTPVETTTSSDWCWWWSCWLRWFRQWKVKAWLVWWLTLSKQPMSSNLSISQVPRPTLCSDFQSGIWLPITKQWHIRKNWVINMMNVIIMITWYNEYQHNDQWQWPPALRMMVWSERSLVIPVLLREDTAILALKENW